MSWSTKYTVFSQVLHFCVVPPYVAILIGSSPSRSLSVCISNFYLWSLFLSAQLGIEKNRIDREVKLAKQDFVFHWKFHNWMVIAYAYAHSYPNNSSKLNNYYEQLSRLHASVVYMSVTQDNLVKSFKKHLSWYRNYSLYSQEQHLLYEYHIEPIQISNIGALLL